MSSLYFSFIPIDDYIHSSTTHLLLWLLEYIKHAGHVRFSYNPSFLAWNSIFLSQQISRNSVSACFFSEANGPAGYLLIIKREMEKPLIWLYLQSIILISNSSFVPSQINYAATSISRVLKHPKRLPLQAYMSSLAFHKKQQAWFREL